MHLRVFYQFVINTKEKREIFNTTTNRGYCKQSAAQEAAQRGWLAMQP